MPILLSDEEIPSDFLLGGAESKRQAFKMGARAQLKNVVEWAEGDCTEHKHHLGYSRWICPHCWQSLKEEAGLT